MKGETGGSRNKAGRKEGSCNDERRRRRREEEEE